MSKSTAGGVSRQRLSPRIIPLCHYRGYIKLFPPQILPPAAAIETWATPHWRLSGSCSNLSYLFAKYFYHRCSDNEMQCVEVLTLMWLGYKMIMIIVSSGWISTNLSPSHPYCLQFPAAPQLWSPNFGDQQWIRFKLNLRWWWVKIWELQVWNWETLNLELYEDENVDSTVATDGGL